MTCIDCGHLRPIMLHQHATVLGRRCEWDVCSVCSRRRQAETDERAREAIEQAEKAGV